MPITVMPGQQRAPGFFESFGAAYQDSAKRAQEAMLAEKELDIAERDQKLREKNLQHEARKFQMENARRQEELGIMRTQMENLGRLQGAQATLAGQQGQSLEAERAMARRNFLLDQRDTESQIRLRASQGGLAEAEATRATAQADALGTELDQGFQALASEDSRFQLGQYNTRVASGQDPIQVSRELFGSDTVPSLEQLSQTRLEFYTSGEATQERLTQRLNRSAGVFLGQAPVAQREALVTKLRSMIETASPQELINSVEAEEDIDEQTKALTIGMIYSIFPNIPLELPPAYSNFRQVFDAARQVNLQPFQAPTPGFDPRGRDLDSPEARAARGF